MSKEKKKQIILIFLVFSTLAPGNARLKLNKIKGYNSTVISQKVKEDHKHSKVSFTKIDFKKRETSHLPPSAIKALVKILDPNENNAVDPDDDSDDGDEEEEKEEKEAGEARELLVALNYMVSELHFNEEGINKQLMHASRNKSESCQFVLPNLKMNKATDRRITRYLTIELNKLWKNKEYSSKLMSLILSCLEYLVLDFKNAQLFNKLKGVSDVVLPMLNSSHSEFHEEAAHVLARALQSCPEVQITAFNFGAIPLLLKRVLNDSNSDIQIHSLYSLEYLTKNFPVAQAIFVKYNGFSIFSELFERERENHRIIVKLVSMILDLLLEHKQAIKAHHDIDPRIKTVYRMVGLEKILQNTGWCQKIFRVLLNQVNIGQAKKKAEILLESRSDWNNIIFDIDLPLVDICYSVFHIKPVEEMWFHELLL